MFVKIKTAKIFFIANILQHDTQNFKKNVSFLLSIIIYRLSLTVTMPIFISLFKSIHKFNSDSQFYFFIFILSIFLYTFFALNDAIPLTLNQRLTESLLWFAWDCELLIMMIEDYLFIYNFFRVACFSPGKWKYNFSKKSILWDVTKQCDTMRRVFYETRS